MADELLAEPAVRLWAISSMILALKMLALVFAAQLLRMEARQYVTPEDFPVYGGTPVAVPDEGIERIRRAHRNDLENILPFFGIGFVYALTQPAPAAARFFFVGFVLARIAHSIFYLRAMTPHRSIAFGVSYTLVIGMAIAALAQLL